MKVSEIKTILNNVPSNFDIVAKYDGVVDGGMTGFRHLNFEAIEGVEVKPNELKCVIHLKDIERDKF